MLGAVEIGRGQSPQGFANGGRHPEQSLMRRERLRLPQARDKPGHADHGFLDGFEVG